MRIISRFLVCEISFQDQKYVSFYFSFTSQNAVRIPLFLLSAQKRSQEFPERLYIILCRIVSHYLTATRTSLPRTSSFYYYRGLVLITFLRKISSWCVLIQTRVWKLDVARKHFWRNFQFSVNFHTALSLSDDLFPTQPRGKLVRCK